jgi:hypothetical protein
MAKKAAGETKSKAEIIREAAVSVGAVDLPTKERNPAIRAYVDKHYAGFDWSTNPSALIAGALKTLEGPRARKRAAREEGETRGTRDGRRRAAREQSAASMSTEETLVFVLRAGGFDKARQALESLQGNQVVEFAVACGGVAEALARVESAESRVGS